MGWRGVYRRRWNATLSSKVCHSSVEIGAVSNCFSQLDEGQLVEHGLQSLQALLLLFSEGCGSCCRGSLSIGCRFRRVVGKAGEGVLVRRCKESRKRVCLGLRGRCRHLDSLVFHFECEVVDAVFNKLLGECSSIVSVSS